MKTSLLLRHSQALPYQHIRNVGTTRHPHAAKSPCSAQVCGTFTPLTAVMLHIAPVLSMRRCSRGVAVVARLSNCNDQDMLQFIICDQAVLMLRSLLLIFCAFGQELWHGLWDACFIHAEFYFHFQFWIALMHMPSKSTRLGSWHSLLYAEEQETSNISVNKCACGRQHGNELAAVRLSRCSFTLAKRSFNELCHIIPHFEVLDSWKHPNMPTTPKLLVQDSTGIFRFHLKLLLVLHQTACTMWLDLGHLDSLSKKLTTHFENQEILEGCGIPSSKVKPSMELVESHLYWHGFTLSTLTLVPSKFKVSITASVPPSLKQ